jgi:predicted Zn finger-like uncharacterized protein
MSTENDLVAKCPQCGSVFRLTPQHLQAAKGWVQCGMCGHVFHSGINPTAKPSTAPTSLAETPVEPTPAAEEAKPEAFQMEAVAEPAIEAPAETAVSEDAGSPALSGLAHRMAEQEIPSDFGPKLESIILVDPNVLADDDFGPLPVIESKPETPKPDAPKSEAPAPASTASTPPPGGWGARQASATSTGWIPRRPAAPPPAKNIKKAKWGWVWTVLVLILLLVLAMQLVYFLRDKLAASYPEFRPVMEAICDDLNCTLNLPRDTKQVLILGSDLQTENEGNLALEVTLANRASHAMAWPVLELTLTDVEDQPVARRMFAPSEYLPSGRMEADGIQARSEIPFNLQLQSKGLKAAGYRLRMFY